MKQVDGRKAKIGITPNPQGARGGGEVIASVHVCTEYRTGKKKSPAILDLDLPYRYYESKNSAGSRLPVHVFKGSE